MNVKLGFNIYTALIVLLLVVASKTAENYYSSGGDYLSITGFQAASSVPAQCDKYFGDPYCDDNAEYCGSNYKSFSYTACRECRLQRDDPKTTSVVDVKYGSDKCAKYWESGSAAAPASTAPAATVPASAAPSPVSASPSVSGSLQADFNSNGCVDSGDFKRLLRYARGSPLYQSKYSQSQKAKLDLNSDGNVDNADIQAFSLYNGNGCFQAFQQIKTQSSGSGAVQTPASPAAVPSPPPVAKPAVPSAQPSGSCQNSCGAKSKTGACYCDDYSVTHQGDYCSDIAAQCPTVWNNPNNKFK